MHIKGAIMVPHPPMIIPDIGRGQEAMIQETIRAYEEAAGKAAEWEPETIVLISPHATMYADYFHVSPGKKAKGDFRQFNAPQVCFKVEYDAELVETLSELCQKQGLMAGTLGERDPELDHGTMVPLYFINQKYRDYQLVRVGLSGLSLTDHYKLGQMIKASAERLNRKLMIVGSGDLSHCLKRDGPYGYKKEGPVYDKRIMDIMGSGDFLRLFDFTEDFRSNAGECGHGSFAIMAGALDQTAINVKRLSYQDVTGVGYGICVYETTHQDDQRNFREQYKTREAVRLAKRKAEEDAYVKLARASLEHYVKSGKPLDMPESLPEELTTHRAGTFVSLKKEGRLRGCIGTIGPVRGSVAEEILANAISAGTEDPRFSPVSAEELEELEYSVDVLGRPEPVDSEAQLDAERYGVIVTNGNRRGLLLPNLEGVDTPFHQIAIARQKAGISPDEPVDLERFEVVRHR